MRHRWNCLIKVWIKVLRALQLFYFWCCCFTMVHEDIFLLIHENPTDNSLLCLIAGLQACESKHKQKKSDEVQEAHSSYCKYKAKSPLGWFRCCCKRRMFTESQRTCRTGTAGTSRTPVDLFTVIDALTGTWTMPQKPV